MPWVAIAPVVSAIHVPERMVPDRNPLFDHLAHDLRKARPGTGSLKLSALSDRIKDLTAWADTEAAARQLSGETIPPDPRDKLGTGRFRRSLAWHMRRSDQQRRDKTAGGWLPLELSSPDTISKNVVGRTGFEPVTSSVSGKFWRFWGVCYRRAESNGEPLTCERFLTGSG